MASFKLTAVVTVCVLVAACSNDAPKARVYRIETLGQAIGGPKAVGNVGDWMLENNRIRVVVNGQPADFNGGGINRWGGSIVDADIVRLDKAGGQAAGKDDFLEIIPSLDISTLAVEREENDDLWELAEGSFEVLSDGSDGGAAELLVRGSVNYLLPLMQVLPTTPTGGLKILVEQRYRLEPDANWVEMISTFKLAELDESPADETIDLPLRPLAATDDVIGMALDGDLLGDVIFYGDGLDIIGPGAFGFSADVFAAERLKLGITNVSAPPAVDWSAGVNDNIGYGVVSTGGPLLFPIIESFLTIAFHHVREDASRFSRPGAAYTVKRYFVVDDGDVAGILDHVITLKGWDSGRIEGRVLDADGRGASGTKVVVFEHPRWVTGGLVPLQPTVEAMDAWLATQPATAVSATRLVPYSRFVADVRQTDQIADGSFAGRLPVDAVTGERAYLLTALGPANTETPLLPVTVRRNQTAKVGIVLPPTGKLRVEVLSNNSVDPHEPAEIRLIDVDGVFAPNPTIGQSFIPAQILAIHNTLDGRAEFDLPPGRYRVIAGRGYEYTVDERTVTVVARSEQTLRLNIARVVDTSGWAAVDPHTHGDRSPDSGRSAQQRVLDGLGVGVDIMVATDHDAITPLEPALAAMGGRGKIKLPVGNELSQMDYAHFISFPLVHRADLTAGGAVPWRDPSPSSAIPEYTPQDAFDALINLADTHLISSDPFRLVNHTQELFTGYFRAFGWEQYRAQFGSPDILTLFNPVVHNGAFFSPDASKNFSWDFHAIDVINAKRSEDYRTATVEEAAQPTSAEPNPPPKPWFPTLVRTAEEQARIISGDLRLESSERGMLDDYMTVLVTGRKIGGVGVSDSHGRGTEIGQGRTYVMSSSDDPRHLIDDEINTNMKAGRMIASSGPFVEVWVNGQPIGSELSDADGNVDVRIRAQAAPWVSLDRLEIYGNGVLIGDIGRDAAAPGVLACDTAGLELASTDQVVRLDATFACPLTQDTALNVVAIGYTPMTPYIQPLEGPSIEASPALLVGLNELVLRWVGIDTGVPANPQIEPAHGFHPYAVANAIWIDLGNGDQDNDGRDYDGPGFIPGRFDDEEESGFLKRERIRKWIDHARKLAFDGRFYVPKLKQALEKTSF